MKRKFSDEDLRELLAYIASNPAFPFPELTPEEREQLIADVMEELDDLEKSQTPNRQEPRLLISQLKDKAHEIKAKQRLIVRD